MRRNFLRFGKRSGGGGVAPEGAKDDDYSMENSSNDGLDMVSGNVQKKRVYLKTLSKSRLNTYPPTLFLTNYFLTIFN